MRTNWIKNLIPLLLSTILSLSIFFGVDWYLTKKGLSDSYDKRMSKAVKKPYLEGKDGWYSLKKSFSGSELWGHNLYPVYTDNFGLRVKNQSFQNRSSKPKYIFLGDSFTFGINGPWDETFVGMFAKGFEDHVANAGVSSYSPTAYEYIYQQMEKSGLLSNRHKLIISIDISDVQDEATRWIKNEFGSPRLRPSKLEVKFYKNTSLIESYLKENLNFSYLIYIYLRKLFGMSQSVASREADDVFEMPRSAFTFSKKDIDNLPYPLGYYPEGVSQAKKIIENRVSGIKDICDKYSCDMYLLIYPWPAQIKHPEGNQDWVNYINQLCKNNKCSGVINMFDSELMQKKYEEAYKEYYVNGDVHFNVVGNKIVYKSLIKTIKPN